jgi:hypothetical protein
MTTPPPRIEEWRKWLEVINREIVVLHHNRRLFSEMMQMIRGHPTLPKWTYPALVDRVTLTDSGFADHLLSNSSGDRYPRAECRLLRL